MGELERLVGLMAQAPLFGTLDEGAHARLAGIFRPVTFAPGAELASAGEPASALVLVSAGRVRVATRPFGDLEVEQEEQGAGATTGASALLQGAASRIPCFQSVTAIDEVRGYALAASDFSAWSQTDPAAAASVMQQLSLRLATLVRRVEGQLASATLDSEDVAPGSGAHPASFGQSRPVQARFREQLSLVSFLAGLTEAERDLVMGALRQWSLPRGAQLFHEATPGPSCYVTVQGTVQISVRRGLRVQHLGVHGPGKLLGALSFVDEGARTFTATARQKAVFLELERAAFDQLRVDHPATARKLLENACNELMERLAQADARLIALKSDTAPSPPPSRPDTVAQRDFDRDALLQRIRQSVIGDNVVLDGPFGRRRMVYADYTASGRALSFIEEFIRHEVLPLYANTHSESSGTGLQTTQLREDARAIIHRATGGNADDCVIFCGSGATGAIDKIQGVLNLKVPLDLDREHGLTDKIPAEQRPVVFVGPYEHHANDVSWRMTIADVVMIDENEDGHIDQKQLEAELIRYRDRPLKIGSFSAASNVTGVITDTHAIAKLLHRHGALSFWDYAAAAPYLPIDMNPQADGEDGHLAYKDAVFLSPHKFIGGPGTPGVLVAKQALFRNTVPTVPAGGTVAYVSQTEQQFLADPVHREEGGTPAIIESIRAGLVFQLKEAVGVDTIREREHQFVRRAIDRWSDNPNIWILGNPELDRLSIISFVLRYGDRYLHWNYVVALLNDLFGIQARGGCSCAGPYGHILFNIGDELSQAYQCEIQAGYEGIKPGWVRVNFNYFISEAVFTYILDAVDLVARHGWKLLPHYRFDLKSALWSHRLGPPRPQLRLNDLRYVGGQLTYRAERTEEPDDALSSYLARAEEVFARAGDELPPVEASMQDDLDSLEKLRWFPLPEEVHRTLSAAE